MSYENLIDKTDFGTVRRYILAARSPIAHVLFVAARDMLSTVAAVLDDPARRNTSAREIQVRWWIQAGFVRMGVTNANEQSEAAIDMERIEQTASCSVLYMPPVYLVHLPGLEAFRHPTSWTHCSDAKTLTLLK